MKINKIFFSRQKDKKVRKNYNKFNIKIVKLFQSKEFCGTFFSFSISYWQRKVISLLIFFTEVLLQENVVTISSINASEEFYEIRIWLVRLYEDR